MYEAAGGVLFEILRKSGQRRVVGKHEEERKKELRIRRGLESTLSVTFNGFKQTVSAEGKWALGSNSERERAGGGSGQRESPPPHPCGREVHELPVCHVSWAHGFICLLASPPV